MNKQSVTVAISTRYGGANLVKASKSIAMSSQMDNFRFIVIADTRPIRKSHLKKLNEMGVEVYEYKQSRTLAEKLKQIIRMTKTEILVFTQDDVFFDKNALAEICKVMEDKKVTEVSSRSVPFPAMTFLERIVEVGARGTYKMGEIWNGSDNYLMASGRCMAFRMNTLRKARIIDGVTNLDAYLYFENKRLGGKFKFAKNSIVFIRSPRVVKEHMHQSNRFQYSKEEMKNFFSEIDIEYKIPLSIYLRVGITQFIKNPIFALLYAFMFVISRLKKLNRDQSLNPLWKTDASTKKI